MRTVEVDQHTAVYYRGIHRDVYFKIVVHNFKPKDHDTFYDFPEMWATYVLLSEEYYEKFGNRVDNAPWNGGITYRKRILEEHMDCSEEMKEKWNKPYYKIGDDFSHLWDHENRAYELYDRKYMENHIKRVIDYLIDGEVNDD